MTLYQPGIPTGTVDLDQDYQNLQNNFQQLDTTFFVDHVKFSVSENNGCHRAIHMVPVSTTTTNGPNNQPINGYKATPGLGQIFDAQITDGYDTDEALFFLTGGDKLTQLTRNFVPVLGTSGKTFLPGGLIVQWGFVSGTHGGPKPHFNNNDSGSVTLGFVNACYGVQINLIYSTNPVTGNGAPSGTGTVSYDLFTLSATNFDWVINTSSGSYSRFFWIAIGS